MPLEEELLKAAQKGSSAAFDKLMIFYEKRVYGYAYAKTGNPDDALDLSQEIFFKLYKSLPGFRGDCSFDSFLYRLMSTCTVDFLKRRKKHETAPLYNDEDEPIELKSPEDVEKIAEQKELKAEILKAVDTLNEEQKECFVLRDVNGLSYEEISVLTSVDVATVKTRIFRARKKIRDYLLLGGNKKAYLQSNIDKGGD